MSLEPSVELCQPCIELEQDPLLDRIYLVQELLESSEWKNKRIKSIHLSEINNLPKSPAIYFVLAEPYLLYIGSTGNLNQRWNNPKYPHHNYQLLKEYDHKDIRVGWISYKDKNTLMLVEAILINAMHPLLNLARRAFFKVSEGVRGYGYSPFKQESSVKECIEKFKKGERVNKEYSPLPVEFPISCKASDLSIELFTFCVSDLVSRYIASCPNNRRENVFIRLERVYKESKKRKKFTYDMWIKTKDGKEVRIKNAKQSVTQEQWKVFLNPGETQLSTYLEFTMKAGEVKELLNKAL